MSVGEKMKQRRKELKISADEIAEKLNVSRSTIFRYEKGDIEKLPTNILNELAVILKTTPAYLMGWENSNKNDITSIYNELKPPRKEVVYKFAERQLKEQNESPKVVQLPIIEDDKEIEILSGHQSAAGFAILGDDSNMTSTVMKASKVPNGADEVVAIKGNSMEPLIMDGEQVFIRHQPSVENGEIAIVAIFDDGITCKKVYYDDAEGTVTLESVNDDYEDMVFPVEDIRIIGKVLGK
ncbi:helix-turn-helix domain-containing protein [Carnobacterium maltaromaticum]|uniref:helix-turn-helix domain-containing protein n=1 Tax=Carnobacterium maltaromaticum TaxID=2751 RepID=UPI0039BE2BD8